MPTRATPTFLAAAMATAFASSALAEDAPLRADGTALRVTPGNYETREDDSSALVVLRGGQASGRNSQIGTHGARSHAASVSGNLSILKLTGGGLHTRGDSAWGIHIQGSGATAATLRELAILTEGSNAAGAYLHQKGSRGSFERTTIETRGRVAAGIVAEEYAAVSFEGSTIHTLGDESPGIRLQDDAESLDMRDGTIETAGKGSNGVILGRSSAGAVAGSHITTTGHWATAFGKGSGSGQLSIVGTELRTHGEESAGFSAQDGGFAFLRDTVIETSGPRSAGVDDRASAVNLKDVTVVTHGRSSYGLAAKGGDYAGRFPLVEALHSSVSTDGRFAYGASASGGGRMVIEESTLQTQGENAHGLRIDGGDAVVIETRTATTGKDAYGAIVANGGSLFVEGGNLMSDQSAALGVANPGDIRIVAGARLVGGNGAFVEVDRGSTSTFNMVISGDSEALGDIRWLPEQAPNESPGSDAARPSLSLEDRAHWQGATDLVDHLSLTGGGTWTVTDNSRTGSLTNQGGIVAFASAVPFTTLTVDGDYMGEGGLLHMRTSLGDDDSPSDRLHVIGNTSGHTSIAIDTLRGTGDYTHDGIRLIQVDGKSEANFELSGRAVAGAHEYFLRKGGLAAPDDGHWYLRSSLPPNPVIDPVIDPVVDPVVEPEVKPKPEEPDPSPVIPVVPEPEPTAPLLRPEVGTYRANQVAALDMFRRGPGGGEDDKRSPLRGNAWARFERQHTAFDVDHQIATTSSTSVLTLGTDLIHADAAGDGSFGIMIASGHANTRGSSSLTGYGAEGRTRGLAAGVYGGFRTDNGTVVRSWLNVAHVNQRVEGRALPPERYGTGLVTGSIEIARRWRRRVTPRTDIWVEPQAQITATRLHGGAHTEAGRTAVAPLHASGADTRIGVRMAARWQTPAGHIASPYLAASWIRRLGRLDATTFDGEPFTAGVPRNSYGLKLGTTFLRKTGWRAWADVETRFGARRYRRVTGSLGMRRAW